MPTVHIGDFNLIRSAIRIYRLLGNLGVLTTSNITAADTVNGLMSAIKTGMATQHESYKEFGRMGIEATKYMVNLGVLSDAAILSLTTVASLITVLETVVGANSVDDPPRADGGENFDGVIPVGSNASVMNIV